MRERLTELGAPVPRVGARSPPPTTSRPSRRRPAGRWSLKAARGGYDGRGVWMLADVAEPAAELLAAGTELIVEERVPLRRELAALVARSPFGQVAAYPVVETVQRDGICVEVLAPAPELPEELALDGAAARHRSPPRSGVVGLLAVELFETARRHRRQRAGDAPAQLRALDDRGRPDVAVRAAPAGRARLPDGRHRR